jgi:hypothetical protein
MYEQTSAWRMPPAEPFTPAAPRADGASPPGWLTFGLLALASFILLALACASAWLLVD